MTATDVIPRVYPTIVKRGLRLKSHGKPRTLKCLYARRPYATLVAVVCHATLVAGARRPPLQSWGAPEVVQKLVTPTRGWYHKGR